MKWREKSGNSLVEYVLPLTILVGASGFIMLASGGSDAISEFLKNGFNGNVSNHNLEIPALGTVQGLKNTVSIAANSTATGASNPSSGPSTGITLSLPNGQTINIANHLSNLQQLVETLGANGATELLMGDLKTLAQQLLASKQITQAQANGLLALANQGHLIAQAEDLIRNAAKNASNNTDFLNTQVNFNGQTYTVKALNALLGWNDNTLSSQEAPFHLSNANQETAAFINLYNAALQSGSMSNPAVSQLVQSLAGPITIMSDGVNTAVNYAISGKIAPSDFNSKVASETSRTNGNSAGICQAGNGQDSGISCSG